MATGIPLGWMGFKGLLAAILVATDIPLWMDRV